MKAEPVLMIQMPINELERMIREAIDASLDIRFEPLRRQFEERLLDVNEVCDILSVTRMTLHNLEKRKELMPVRIGSKVRYKESVLTAYLTEKKDNNI